MNFCDERLREHERIALFSDFDGKLDEPIKLIGPDTKLEDLVVLAGIFPSKSQARKNNWFGDLPEGYNDIKIGKRMLHVFFLPVKRRPIYERWWRIFGARVT